MSCLDLLLEMEDFIVIGSLELKQVVNFQLSRWLETEMMGF